MTDFAPVSTLADLDTLNADEIVAGYCEWRPGDPEPGLNRGRAYWHGWMNRAYDRGAAPYTEARARLAHALVTRGRERRSA